METIHTRIVSLRKDVSLWETGRRAPDLQSALLLADYFHTTLDHLVKGEHG